MLEQHHLSTHPTDTGLLGMKMWKGMKLTSWKSSSDPARGLFSYGMDMSPGKTQMMMLYNNTVPYLSSGEWAGDFFADEPVMEGSKKLQASCVRLSPSRIYISSFINPIDHILTGRFLLAENGGFEFYYLMDDGGWSLRWSTYRGECSDYEICGSYGLCNANDVHSCVQGFTPKNGSEGWWSSGCARRMPLYCSVIEAFALAISDRPVCRLSFGDLFGNRISSEGQSVFIRLAASEFRHSTSERRIKASALAILLTAAASFIAVSALLLAAFFLWKRRRLLKKNVEEEIISGRRNLDLKVDENRFYFPTWASSQIQKGNIIELVDARIVSEANVEEVRRAALVAGLCIQDDENHRPSMSEVVKILEGRMEAPMPQIPRSLQVLVDQADDEDSDGFCKLPSISSASVPAKQ
ncbi:hypothetical protein SUGI_1090230 [Cryptomeria japonica]|nr:hypothetical protein SUGI_1090230 [Cryptomeria japonica]